MGLSFSLSLSISLSLSLRFSIDILTQTLDDKEDDDMAAKTSSKEEEFLAICELRGVGADAPLARQLKAVEAEYHALKEQKNQQKAEHVQMLYSWKSAQVAKVWTQGFPLRVAQQQLTVLLAGVKHALDF